MQAGHTPGVLHESVRPDFEYKELRAVRSGGRICAEPFANLRGSNHIMLRS